MEALAITIGIPFALVLICTVTNKLVDHWMAPKPTGRRDSLFHEALSECNECQHEYQRRQLFDFVHDKVYRIRMANEARMYVEEMKLRRELHQWVCDRKKVREEMGS